ncbi:14764_t:CDS:2, partial [Cetraspora pellucida]
EESDVELLASTSTSTPALSTSALSTQNTKVTKKKKTKTPDNKEVEVEKVSCKFEDRDTKYVWLGSTSNCITHLRNIHQITKESLKNTLVKAKQQTIYQLDEHHASDIVESVNSVLNKFKINCQNVFPITTNNGSNVRSTVQQMGLKKVDEIISKCKALISILSKEKKHRQLCEAQLQITPELKEPLDVIKDMNTCWNFTLYAIEHLVYLKPAIIQLYSTLTNLTIRKVRKGAETMGSYIPSSEEFELLEELIEVLSPFDEATQFLSGSKYPILGFIIPILKELAHRLRYFIGQNSMAILVKDTIFRMPDEFDRYCELPSIALDEESCPLEWWSRRYFAVPASSVPSERLFSNARNHVMDKHNRLDPDFLNKLVFLKKNMKSINIFSSLN